MIETLAQDIQPISPTAAVIVWDFVPFLSGLHRNNILADMTARGHMPYEAWHNVTGLLSEADDLSQKVCALADTQALKNEDTVILIVEGDYAKSLIGKLVSQVLIEYVHLVFIVGLVDLGDGS